MIELTETPTFVIDDDYDPKNICLFSYFDLEEIPYEVLELSSVELPYRDKVYYPVVLDSIGPGIDYSAIVNPRALYKAQDEELVIVFIYTGIVDPTSIVREELMRWIIANDITIKTVRFISSNKASEIMPPFIFFPFAELDAMIEMKDKEVITDFNTDHRENIFTCSVPKDTAHARLFGASIWYHALYDTSHFAYCNKSDDPNIIESPIYNWHEHWSSTGTLMDMFGQQLPIIDTVTQGSDIYEDSYWNLLVDDTFNIRELSLCRDVFNPIANVQPFIMIGPPGQAKLLQSLGYETFENFVNEIHDTIVDNETRMQALFRLVYEMVHYTDEELVEINERIRFICEHNQTHFFASKRFRMLNLLKQLHDGKA